MRIRCDLHKREDWVEGLKQLCNVPKEELAMDIRNNLQLALTTKKMDLEARMDKLRGSNGFNGAIHAAWESLQSAALAMECACGEFEEKFLLGKDFETCRDISRTFSAIKKPKEEYEKASRRYYRLVGELSRIAKFSEDGTIVAGTYFSILASFKNIDDFAKNAAEKLLEFYQELATPVTRYNYTPRHSAITRIMHSLTNALPCAHLAAIALNTLDNDIYAISPRSARK